MMLFVVAPAALLTRIDDIALFGFHAKVKHHTVRSPHLRSITLFKYASIAKNDHFYLPVYLDSVVLIQGPNRRIRHSWCRRTGRRQGRSRPEPATFGAYDIGWHPLICRVSAVYDRSEVRFVSESSRSVASSTFSSIVRVRDGSAHDLLRAIAVPRASARAAKIDRRQAASGGN
jgi:hypothetical protein